MIEKLLRYLGYASWAEPFGRPLLSALGVYINRDAHRTLIYTGAFGILALQIWGAILIRNRGLSYDFILGRLPYAPDEIFVDAASSWHRWPVRGELFSYTETGVSPIPSIV